jgi:hypothetical protein
MRERGVGRVEADVRGDAVGATAGGVLVDIASRPSAPAADDLTFIPVGREFSNVRPLYNGCLQGGFKSG